MINEQDFKIAQDSDEAFWAKLEKETQERIKSFEREIIIHREVLALAISKQNKEMEAYGE